MGTRARVDRQPVEIITVGFGADARQAFDEAKNKFVNYKANWVPAAHVYECVFDMVESDPCADVRFACKLYIRYN